MDNEKYAFLIDITLSLVVIVFSIVIYINTLDLPPPKYEPMGAAALPRALAVLLAIFSLFIMIKAFFKRRSAVGPAPATQQQGDGGAADTYQRGYLKAAVVFVLTCIYVALMSSKLTGFMLTTTVYMFLAGITMKETNIAGKVKMGVFAIAFSLSTFFIFTRFFYIDLP